MSTDVKRLVSFKQCLLILALFNISNFIFPSDNTTKDPIYDELEDLNEKDKIDAVNNGLQLDGVRLNYDYSEQFKDLQRSDRDQNTQTQKPPTQTGTQQQSTSEHQTESGTESSLINSSNPSTTSNSISTSSSSSSSLSHDQTQLMASATATATSIVLKLQQEKHGTKRKKNDQSQEEDDSDYEDEDNDYDYDSDKNKDSDDDYEEQANKKRKLAKKHKCEECGKASYRKRDLANHMLTHTGEKPFECDICKRRFSIKSNLKVHKKRHK